jgi:hypothetical protein
MTIAEMHTMFREYTQRAGMQEVYDIRPEQIDKYLNMAIRATVMQRIQASMQDVDARAVSTIIKTGQNNDFRTLFKVTEIPCTKVGTVNPIFTFDADGAVVGKLVVKAGWPITDAWIYYDWHLSYCVASPGWTASTIPVKTTNGFISKQFRVRLIEHNYLGTTLADNILAPNIRNPIVCVYAGATVSALTLDLYLGKLSATGFLETNLVPYKLYVGYYTQPVTVAYNTDVNGAAIECNLPDHLHSEIVLRAIQDFNAASGRVQPSGKQPS